MLLLHQKAFGPVAAELGGGQQNRNAARQQTGGGRRGVGAGVGISPLISWGAMERIYPRYPTIESIDLSDAERRMWMDLRPYVNTAPYVINGAYCLSSSSSLSLVVVIEVLLIRCWCLGSTRLLAPRALVMLLWLFF